MPLHALIPAILSSVVGNYVDDAINAYMDAPPAPPEIGVIGTRAFPEGTLKGSMDPLTSTNEVVISGKTYLRSPGMQIRNQQNLIVMSSAIQSAVPVRFQLDPSGAVFRVWVLTRNEVAMP